MKSPQTSGQGGFPSEDRGSQEPWEQSSLCGLISDRKSTASCWTGLWDAFTVAASSHWRKRMCTQKTNGRVRELQLPLDPLFSMNSHVSDHSWCRRDVLLHVL